MTKTIYLYVTIIKLAFETIENLITMSYKLIVSLIVFKLYNNVFKYQFC